NSHAHGDWNAFCNLCLCQRSSGDGNADAFRHDLCFVDIGLWQQNDKLFSSKAPQRVTTTQHPVGLLANLAQNRVASAMPKGIIDVLEAVSIKEQKREWT